MGYGGKVTSLDFIRVVALTLLVLLPFQNCGTDYSSEKESLYTGDGYGEGDCLSEVVDCGANQDFLQISIDLPNPSTVGGSTTSYTLYGRCNSGNYEEHLIHWEVRDASSSVVNQGNESMACVRGRYQFNASLSGVAASQLYSFYVHIVGIDGGGSGYRNLQSNGSAEIDFNR